MTAPMTADVRGGVGNWFLALSAMLRWHLTSLRLVLPVMIVVQMLIASGLSIGMSLFFASMDTQTGLFLGTGAAIITLILVGLVVAPQLVAGEKEAGTYDFTASLPVPRSASAVGWVVVTALISLPAAVVALLLAAWRFDLDFTVTWSVVPATFLVLACGTLIGYAVAHGVEKPTLTQILSQVFAFLVIGFTPITYPPGNLPGWMATAHEALPFYHMGVIIRGALTEGLVSGVGRSYLVVAAWTVVAAAVTAVVVRRRK